MGQDITTLGGQFGLSKALMGKFGENRVRDTAINETFMIGGACGAAIGGAVPVVDITFSDFLFIAGDEVFNKLAKWRFMHGGHPNELPVTVIAGTGILGGSGAEHNSSIEAHMLHNPGLKVVVPSTPADVKGLLKTAIRDPDPVIFMPNKGMYLPERAGPGRPRFTIPFGEAATRRERHVGHRCHLQRQRAGRARGRRAARPQGIDLEVIDLRTLVPLDWDASTSRCARPTALMIVHEACRTGGVGAEIAARVQEELLYWLESPISRVCGADTHIPQNQMLEQYCIPSVDDVVEGVRALMES